MDNDNTRDIFALPDATCTCYRIDGLRISREGCDVHAFEWEDDAR